MTREILLGRVFLQSLNQVGESAKYDSKSGGFVLSRKGSIFEMLVYPEDDEELADFRSRPSVNICLRTQGIFLSLDPETGRAIGVESFTDIPPPEAQLEYVRRKFDGTSVSLKSAVSSTEVWLRHSNSKLRFDEAYKGYNFTQDAAFMVISAGEKQHSMMTPMKQPAQSENVRTPNSFSVSQEKHANIPQASGSAESVEARTLSERIDDIMAKTRAISARYSGGGAREHNSS